MTLPALQAFAIFLATITPTDDTNNRPLNAKEVGEQVLMILNLRSDKQAIAVCREIANFGWEDIRNIDKDQQERCIDTVNIKYNNYGPFLKSFSEKVLVEINSKRSREALIRMSLRLGKFESIAKKIEDRGGYEVWWDIININRTEIKKELLRLVAVNYKNPGRHIIRLRCLKGDPTTKNFTKALREKYLKDLSRKGGRDRMETALHDPLNDIDLVLAEFGEDEAVNRIVDRFNNLTNLNILSAMRSLRITRHPVILEQGVSLLDNRSTHDRLTAQNFRGDKMRLRICDAALMAFEKNHYCDIGINASNRIFNSESSNGDKIFSESEFSHAKVKIRGAIDKLFDI